MDALDAGWAILKMPLFHGTSRANWEQMQRDGYLMPTDEAPDVMDYTDEQLVEMFGEDEASRLFDGDWSFAYGDKAPMTRHSIGGRTAGIVNATEYLQDEGDPLLEILDEDAHISEPTGYRAERDQRRSRYPIPVSRIREVPKEEWRDAYLRNLAHQQQAKWLERTMRDLYLHEARGFQRERMDLLDRLLTSTMIDEPERRVNQDDVHPYWSGPQ